MAAPLLTTRTSDDRLTNLLSHRPRQPDHGNPPLPWCHSRSDRSNGVETRHSEGRVCNSIPRIRTSFDSKC
jgi:hypothetical protein